MLESFLILRNGIWWRFRKAGKDFPFSNKIRIKNNFYMPCRELVAHLGDNNGFAWLWIQQLFTTTKFVLHYERQSFLFVFSFEDIQIVFRTHYIFLDYYSNNFVMRLLYNGFNCPDNLICNLGYVLSYKVQRKWRGGRNWKDECWFILNFPIILLL